MLPQSSYELLSKEAMRNIFSILDSAIDSATMKDNVISVDIPNKGTFVINRQPPKREIWVSSPISGPHHFKYKDGKWTDKQKNNLLKLISKEMLNSQFLLE